MTAGDEAVGFDLQALDRRIDEAHGTAAGALLGYLFAFLQDVALTPGEYFKQIADALSWLDFALLALKTIAFGFFIAIVTCYHGLAQPLRLEEVSRVAVRAVTQGVIVCVLIDVLFIVLYLLA